MKMTFHESYGHLPVSTLRLIRKYNVSQGDYDYILSLMGAEWSSPNIDFGAVDAHIVSNSGTGMYRPRFF